MIAQTNLTLPELVEDLELISAPVRGGLPWGWILVGLIALLALVIPLWFVFRPRKVPPTGAATPRPDPGVLAIRRLNALKAALANLSQREAAIELAAILRDYICDRFEIRAPYQTTGEFIRQIGVADHFPAGQGGPVVDLLNTFDLVKFATVILEEGTLEPWIDYVGEFVRSTRPPVEPVADPEGKRG